MSRWTLMLCLALSLASCADDNDEPTELASDGGSLPGTKPDAAGAIGAPDAGAVDAGHVDIDAAVPDAGGGPAAHKACLDQPGVLSAAPAGELPCTLLPPGFAR
jgi:hypothetical protein